jgi:transporter family protein
VATLRAVVILVAMTLLVLGTRQFPALFTRLAAQLCVSVAGARDRGVVVVLLRALQAGGCGARRPLDKLSVVLVAIFGVGVLGERRVRLHWLGVVLVALGAWCVTLKTEPRHRLARATDPATRATRIEQKIPARRVSPSARTIAAAVTGLSALAAGFSRQLRVL